MTKGELPLNWGYAEILAYATLADKGINIRISGEDSKGTFAHRHSVLHDYKNGDTYTPLENLGDKQGRVEVFTPYYQRKLLLRLNMVIHLPLLKI